MPRTARTFKQWVAYHARCCLNKRDFAFSQGAGISSSAVYTPVNEPRRNSCKAGSMKGNIFKNRAFAFSQGAGISSSAVYTPVNEPRRNSCKAGSMQKSIFAIVSTLLCLSGCAVGPDFHSPLPPPVHQYTQTLPEHTVSTPEKGGEIQHFATGKLVPAHWWQLFQQPALDILVEIGLRNNPTLASGQAALRQAQENLRGQIGASLLPAVDAQASATRQRLSDAQFGLGSTPSGGSSIFNLFNTQLNISYTLDIFGGARRQIEALCAQVNYQQYQLEGTLLTLVSNIVTTTITLASLESQREALDKLIAFQSNLLNTTQKQFDLGAVDLSSVLSQKSQLAQLEATKPAVDKNIEQTKFALIALIGGYPSEVVLPSLSLNDFCLPTELPLSIPSLLIKQRPDIRASEALLHQASANIGVATSNLFPQLTLSGNYGYSGLFLPELFQPSNKIWLMTAQVLQPLFHGGSLLAQRRAAIDAYAVALGQYRESVLTGFQNVASALKAIEIDAKNLLAQTEAEQAAKSLLDLSEKQFKLGAVNYLNLLNAEKQYQEAVINKIQAQALRYTDTAALFQALGGNQYDTGQS